MSGPYPAGLFDLHKIFTAPAVLLDTPSVVSAAMELPHVVVIEDEGIIAAAVAARLRSEGFSVDVAHDGLDGVELVEQCRPDLVVLDLMLPGLDGLEVCKRIQRHRPIPVLMLTARESEADLLVGLAVGADDYMTKPFSPRELVARVRTILRRAERQAERQAERGAGAGEKVAELLDVGGVNVDLDGRRVAVDGQTVHLTPTEFDLLVQLARRPGVVFTRDQLLADVWGYRDGSGARTVDSHVRALRQKLGAALIRTVHGVGYSLERPG